MALRAGQNLSGMRTKYQLLDSLKANTVFRAQELNSPIQKWFVVKTANDASEKLALAREYCNYRDARIRFCPCIRALHDIVEGQDPDEPMSLVFEWMDTDLRSILAEDLRRSSILPKTISAAVLSAFELFNRMDKAHTDVNINNIYLSNTKTTSPTVKLGDLGNLITVGSKQRGQSLPCRGLGCQHSSDVWSLGVTLARCLSRQPHFGPADKVIEGHTEAWCIAKIIRLIGSIGPPDSQYQEGFELAEQLAFMEDTGGKRLIQADTLKEQLQQLSDPPVCRSLIEFIESLLIIGHTIRPTAAQALRHSYLQ